MQRRVKSGTAINECIGGDMEGNGAAGLFEKNKQHPGIWLGKLSKTLETRERHELKSRELELGPSAWSKMIQGGARLCPN
jgi:hypothetical protein